MRAWASGTVGGPHATRVGLAGRGRPPVAAVAPVPGAAGRATRSAARRAPPRYAVAAAAAPGARSGAWTASASPRRPSRTTARPSSPPTLATSVARSPPARAVSSRLSSIRAAWCSSSARSLTRKPIALRSSCCGSTRPTSMTAMPAATAAFPSARSGPSAPSASMSRRPAARPATSASTRIPISGWPGATTTSADPGTMATSPGSKASNAGTRALRVRTHATSRSSGACSGAPSDEPAGAMALQSSLKVATADGDQVDAGDDGEGAGV